MTQAIGTGDYYNYNNNQVKVPYRPTEQQPAEEEVVIPYRRQDDAEPEENTDTVKISTHGGAGAQVAYDTSESLSVTAQPYRYNVDIDNGKQNITVSAGPEIGVSGITSQLTDNPLDNLPPNGSVCVNAGVSADLTVKKELETVDNTAVYGDVEVGAGYKHISPNKQAWHNTPKDENPRGDAVDYNASVKVGVEYTSDNNTVGAYARAGVDGYAGKMKQGDPADAHMIDLDGDPQYKETKVNNNVVYAGLGVEYRRNLKHGQFGVSAEGGVGVRNQESTNLWAPGTRPTSTSNLGPFGRVTISYRF